MDQSRLEVIDNESRWDDFVAGKSDGHPQQLSGWAKTKELNGWSSLRLGVVEGGAIQAGAQVLFLQAPVVGYKMAYIPRGPVFASNTSAAPKQLLDALGEYVRKEGATLLRIEPARLELELPSGWRPGKKQILHPLTSIVDLDVDSEDDVIATFKSDARYSIRKAGRRGVKLVLVEDRDQLDEVWSLYQDTAKRAGFNLYAKEYYQAVFNNLGDYNKIWLAYHNDKPAGFIWTAYVNNVAIYLYGGSNELGRDTLANYLLQWEAMKYYHRLGVKKYDLNGHVNDGVSSFKNKFAREQTKYVGTYDLPLKPVQYIVWESVLPRLAPVLRRLKSFASKR